MAADPIIFVDSIAEFLNSEFGSDLSKIQNAGTVLEKLTKYESEINSKLSPSGFLEIGTFDKSAENALNQISKFETKYRKITESASEQADTLKPMKERFDEHLKSVQYLENAQSYLRWILAIENINDLISHAVDQGDTAAMINHYSNFKQIWCKLQTSECRNLKKFIEDAMLHWHNILKEKFVQEFKKTLSIMHWPLFAAGISLNQSPDVMAKFKDLFVILHDIQLPDEYEQQNKSELGNGPFLFPLQFMFEPLQKRFLFHFMGRKLTSQINRPEWVFCQVITWISDHSSFLNQHVQPILDQLKTKKGAKVEFMRCLVLLAIIRLKKDLPILLNDDALLSHAIDSIFVFEHELQLQGYPNYSFPRTLDVISTEPCFSFWKALEHKRALDKMDRLLNSENAWKARYQDEEELDEFRVPECAEVFVTLLHTMTERYQYLVMEKHQQAFMDLQLEILDDFRLRLHQLSQYQVEETLPMKYCTIINAVYYIVMVLNEWSNLPIFLKLYSSKKKPKDYASSDAEGKYTKEQKDIDCEELNGSVFDEAISLLEHMAKDLLFVLCERVLLDVKARSRAYRKEKWFCMPVSQDKKMMDVSPLVFPMLETINSSLAALFELLSKPLFTDVWHCIAKDLDLYIFEEVILQNSFSEGGAEQLQFDMTRNLFPIFSSYCQRPESYFRLVKESCAVLNMSAAPAMLLKEVLKQPDKFEEATGALSELGIQTLSPSQSLIILSQRNDFNT